MLLNTVNIFRIKVDGTGATNNFFHRVHGWVWVIQLHPLSRENSVEIDEQNRTR
jgi:hypothetical protein